MHQAIEEPTTLRQAKPVIFATYVSKSSNRRRDYRVVRVWQAPDKCRNDGMLIWMCNLVGHGVDFDVPLFLCKSFLAVRGDARWKVRPGQKGWERA